MECEIYMIYNKTEKTFYTEQKKPCNKGKNLKKMLKKWINKCYNIK